MIILYNMYIIQSIIFNKDTIGLPDAIRWCVQNGFKVYKVDETKNTYSMRQYALNDLKQNGYAKFRIRRLSASVALVIALASPVPR